MAGFEYSPVNARMLLNLLLWAKGLPLNSDWLTTDPETEAAWFPADRTLVVINNSTQKKSTVVKTPMAILPLSWMGWKPKFCPKTKNITSGAHFDQRRTLCQREPHGSLCQ